MRFGTVAGQLSSYQMSHYSSGSASDRLSVPVRPSVAIFAQYRYISGRPASGEQSTVSLSRIQLMNSLITNLRRLKQEVPDSAAKDTSGENPAQTEALVKEYAAKLHQVITAAPAAVDTPYQTVGSTPNTGMVFSLSV